MFPWVMSVDADDDRAIYANLGHAELDDLVQVAAYDGAPIVGLGTYSIEWPQSPAMAGVAARLSDALTHLDRVHSAIDAWSAQPRSAPDCSTDTAVNLAYARLRAADDMTTTGAAAAVQAYRTISDIRAIAATVADGTLSDAEIERAQATVDARFEQFDSIITHVRADGQELLTTDVGWTVTMPATVRTHGIPTFDIALDDLRADTLGLRGLSVGSAEEASAALSEIDVALEQVWLDAELFDVAQRRVARTMNELDAVCPG